VWWSVALLVLAQLAFVYVPVVQTWFNSVGIGWREWLLTAGLAVFIFLVTEAVKAIGRMRERGRGLR
jgi:hypothetical protein